MQLLWKLLISLCMLANIPLVGSRSHPLLQITPVLLVIRGSLYNL